MDMLQFVLDPMKLKTSCFLCFKYCENMSNLFRKFAIFTDFKTFDTRLKDIINYIIPSHELLSNQACVDCGDLLTHIIPAPHLRCTYILPQNTHFLNKKRKGELALAEQAWLLWQIIIIVTLMMMMNDESKHHCLEIVILASVFVTCGGRGRNVQKDSKRISLDYGETLPTHSIQKLKLVAPADGHKQSGEEKGLNPFTGSLQWNNMENKAQTLTGTASREHKANILTASESMEHKANTLVGTDYMEPVEHKANTLIATESEEHKQNTLIGTLTTDKNGAVTLQEIKVSTRCTTDQTIDLKPEDIPDTDTDEVPDNPSSGNKASNETDNKPSKSSSNESLDDNDEKEKKIYSPPPTRGDPDHYVDDV